METGPRQAETTSNEPLTTHYLSSHRCESASPSAPSLRIPLCIAFEALDFGDPYTHVSALPDLSCGLSDLPLSPRSVMNIQQSILHLSINDTAAGSIMAYSYDSTGAPQ